MNYTKRFKNMWKSYYWQVWQQPDWDMRSPGWAIVKLIGLPIAVVVIAIRATLP